MKHLEKTVSDFYREHLETPIKDIWNELILNKRPRITDAHAQDEARASLLALIQAPITKLVVTMNEVPTKLVRTVDAVKSGKGT